MWFCDSLCMIMTIHASRHITTGVYRRRFIWPLISCYIEGLSSLSEMRWGKLICILEKRGNVFVVGLRRCENNQYIRAKYLSADTLDAKYLEAIFVSDVEQLNWISFMLVWTAGLVTTVSGYYLTPWCVRATILLPSDVSRKAGVKPRNQRLNLDFF